MASQEPVPNAATTWGAPEVDLKLNRHYPGLDGLRGIAILGVILFHSIFVVPQDLANSPSWILDALYSLVEIGWAGVDLFFVLSGFLITGILLETRGKAGYFKSFFARRFLRIFPLYYAALIVLFGGSWLFLQHQESYQWLFRHQGYYWLYLQNWLVLKHGGPFPGFESVGHLWSLAVEEQFYLIWPFVVAAFPARKLLRVSLLIIVLAYLARIAVYEWTDYPPSYLYFLTPFRLDALAIGSALACLTYGDPARLRALMPWWRVVGVGCIILLGVALKYDSLMNNGAFMSRWGYSAVAILSGLFIAEVLFAETATKKEGRRRSLILTIVSPAWLRTIGKYSYAMYIAHWPLMFITTKVFEKIGFIPIGVPARLEIFAPPMVIISYVSVCFAMTAASFISAWISWHLFEKHFLRLKKRFPRPE